MNRILLKSLPWALIALLIGYIYISYRLNSKGSSSDSTVVTHNMIVDKVTQMGKLELTRFYIKDVMEQTEIKNWWPDSKVVLIVSGEVTGCIDLSKIDSTKIKTGVDVLEIILPEPEICYFKIDHSQSKIYDVQNGYFEETKLIDKAYAGAEKNIREAAIGMKILEQSKTQAITFLTPLLQQLSGKRKVVVKFVK